MEKRASKGTNMPFGLEMLGVTPGLKQEGSPPPLGTNFFFLNFVGKSAAHVYPAECPRLTLVSV